MESVPLGQLKAPVQPSPKVVLDSLVLVRFPPILISLWIAPVPGNVESERPNLQHLRDPDFVWAPVSEECNQRTFKDGCFTICNVRVKFALPPDEWFCQTLFGDEEIRFDFVLFIRFRKWLHDFNVIWDDHIHVVRKIAYLPNGKI